MESLNFHKIETKCAILDDKYYIIKTIGVGASGKVKLAKAIQNQQTVAIKMLKEDNPYFQSLKDLFMNEIKILKMVSPHQNIVNFIEGRVGDLKGIDGKIVKVVYIATEYYSGGEMMNYIEYVGAIPESIAK